MSNLDTLKGMIEKCLRDFPHTRNDDIDLQIQVIRLAENNGTLCEFSIPINFLRKYREDYIKRVRAHFQNVKNVYLPSDPQVRLGRKISEEKWFEFVNRIDRVDHL